MNCETVEESLLDYVEGQLDADASRDMKIHIDECPSCRMAHRDTKELIGAIHVAKESQERVISRMSSTTAARSTGIEQPGAWSAGSRLGDFEIIALIGRGGMGTVYRARQVSLNRTVALKILPAGLSQSKDALTRFRREAQAAAKLHHTNIVPVYAQGEQAEHFYYAMEIIDGVDLGRVLKTDPSRIYHSQASPSTRDTTETGADPREASTSSQISMTRPRSDYRRLARLMAQVADALSHAHRNSVLHRDIKPQNLLLGADGQLHITDFGLARLLDEPSLTVTGEMLGTPAYMSPEQIDADRDRIDQRTDIYSLGVTMYELLTGMRPFDGPTREQTIARIRMREPKPPRKLNSNVPIDLETICLRAMEKEPKRRYQNAADMAADLLRYASDKPILSRRVGPIEKTFKWVRRHPAMTTIISLSFVLCVVATLWRVQTARANRDKADDLVRQAFEALAFEDYREPRPALVKLAEAQSLGADPTQFDIADGMGKLLDDTPKAIRRFENALSREPKNVRIMYLLAWACRMDQRIADYEAWVQKADALGGAKTDAAAHFFRGQALVRNEPNEAIESFKVADSLRDSYQIMLHLGRALNHKMYHERTLDNFKRIKDRLGAACELRRKTAYPRYLLSLAHRIAGEIHRDKGQPDLAKTDFEEALALAKQAIDVEPDSPRGYVCEAEYWESMGDYFKALDARDRGEKYCKTTAEQIELFEYRWRLCYWLGRYDRAAKDLESLAKLCPPTDPKYIWHLYFFPALIALETGKPERAFELAVKMAADRPNDTRAISSAIGLIQILGREKEAGQLAENRRAILGTAKPEEPAELFSTGCRALALSERPAALAAFTACEQTYDFDDYCYLAKVITRRMANDKNWPERPSKSWPDGQ